MMFPNCKNIVFRPATESFRQNPYPIYTQIRDQGDIAFWQNGSRFVAGRFESCTTLLKDDRLQRVVKKVEEQPENHRELFRMTNSWMPFINPPDHSRIRKSVNQSFKPACIEEITQTVQTITDKLLDKVQASGRIDIIKDYADLLPGTVIGYLIGIPEEDLHQVMQWSNELASVLDIMHDPRILTRASQTAGHFRQYLAQLADERRANPQDDLMSELVAMTDEEGKLTNDELYGICAFLFIAGQETSVNMIGNGCLALFQNPEQLNLLKNDPSLISSAIEEILRFESPIQLTHRQITETIQYKDIVLPAGAMMVIILGSANRDSAQFTNPDELDITRKQNRHIGFGSGIHFCLGAALARIEGEIAIQTLLDRMPKLALTDHKLEYAENFVLRGLKNLPMTF